VAEVRDVVEDRAVGVVLGDDGKMREAKDKR